METLGKVCQLVFKMERLQLVELETSLSTSHFKDRSSKKWDKPRICV